LGLEHIYHLVEGLQFTRTSKSGARLIRGCTRGTLQGGARVASILAWNGCPKLIAMVNYVGNFYPPSESLRGRFLASLEFPPMETTPDSVDREVQQLSGFSHGDFHLQPRYETGIRLAIYQTARADDWAPHGEI